MDNKILKSKKEKNKDNMLAIMLTALIVIGFLALSWIVNCGIIKLITMCFGLKFKWSIATGIWLIILIARSIFKNND